MLSGLVFRSWKKAAFLSAAFFFFMGPSLAALQESRSKKTETSKDIIEKAYNLSLQKDRSQAVNILVGAIKQENLRNGNVTELVKALQQVSYLFYSDRAQQNFELALSLRRTDLNQAQQKTTEALRVEPDNLSLFNEMQRMLMIKGDCAAVFENVTRERQQNPFDESLGLIQAQAQACLARWDGYLKTRDGFELKKSVQIKFWTSLEIEYALATKNLPKAREQLVILQKLDSKYPEVDYWQWRVVIGPEKAAAAQKYLKECKNISAILYRQYMTDVNLCRRVTDVETASKNGNGPTE
jgi:hypothetical protein